MIRLALRMLVSAHASVLLGLCIYVCVYLILSPQMFNYIRSTLKELG